jgi:hypothetical protein
MTALCARSCIASDLKHLCDRGAKQGLDVSEHLVLVILGVSCYQDQPVSCGSGSVCRLELWQPVVHIIRNVGYVSLHSSIKDTISNVVTSSGTETELYSKVSLEFLR